VVVFALGIDFDIADIRTYGSLALAKLKLEREYNNKIES
jgi:hypothetical protein